MAAGLGQMGIHRNVIHPRFGNFILLATILIDAEVSEQIRPIDYNPCLECKLCVAACPVGAIAPDGHFDFSACLTHNYREFLGGFADWVEAGRRQQGRPRLPPPGRATRRRPRCGRASGSGPNYKAAYCMAACPAGDDVIGPFLDDRKGFLKEVVNPLQEKEEPVYVVPGSDAEAYVTKRFPHKRPRRVGGGRRPTSIRSFLSGLPHVFQRHASEGLYATYHFTFTGEEPAEATVVIRDKAIRVERGSRRHARPPHHRRQPHLARVPGEGAEPGLGSDPQADRAQGLAPAAPGVRQVLPVVETCGLREKRKKKEKRKDM